MCKNYHKDVADQGIVFSCSPTCTVSPPRRRAATAAACTIASVKWLQRWTPLRKTIIRLDKKIEELANESERFIVCFVKTCGCFPVLQEIGRYWSSVCLVFSIRFLFFLHLTLLSELLNYERFLMNIDGAHKQLRSS